MDLIRFVHTCSDYVRPTCAQKGIEVVLRLDQEPFPSTDDQRCVVMGEVDALEKIIFNLLFNAIKHSPRDSQIELGSDGHPIESAFMFPIQDEAFRPTDKTAYFASFPEFYDPTKRRLTGTGLGLALVKELTEAMGGEVGVESEEGKGSNFFCHLNPTDSADQPVIAHERTRWAIHDEPESEEVDEEAIPTVERPEALILVVDDLPDMRRMLVSRLVGWNYAALSAGDGLAALELAREHRPDLIITDWLMPRMDGLEFIEELKRDPELASIPVTLLTARSDEESRVQGTTSGADAFLGKPFNSQELQHRPKPTEPQSQRAGSRTIESSPL